MKPKDLEHLELGQELSIETHYGVEVWKRIQAFQAKNWDGEKCGYRPGTVEGDRVLLERMFIPNDESLPVRFTNYW